MILAVAAVPSVMGWDGYKPLISDGKPRLMGGIPTLVSFKSIVIVIRELTNLGSI